MSVPQEELDSALLHLAQVLTGRSKRDVAWWLCANHAKFLIDRPNLNTQFIMQEAAKAGTPPKGDSWEEWFDRVRNLKR